MNRSVRATFTIFRILGEMAVALAVFAVILGKASEAPHAVEHLAADGPARVVVHDDGDLVHLAVEHADGEAVTRLVVEDPAGRRRLTLNLMKDGGADVAFGQGGPNQAVAWSNRDGTVAFSVRSPKSRIEHQANPDGTVRLAIHVPPFPKDAFEVIHISARGTLSHEHSLPAAEATGATHWQFSPGP